MSKWEELMENDSTMQDYQARYETGEATEDDYLRLAADSMINGNFTDATSYVLKSIGDDASFSEATEAVATVADYAGMEGENSMSILINRLSDRLNGSSAPR